MVYIIRAQGCLHLVAIIQLANSTTFSRRFFSAWSGSGSRASQ